MPPTEEAPRRPARWVGALVVIVPLALAVPGASAVPAAWRLAPARHGELPVEVLVDSLAVLFTLAAAGFLVALARSVARRRRPSDDEEPQPQGPPVTGEAWARVVAVLAVLVALAAPFVALTVVARFASRSPAPVPPTTPRSNLGSPPVPSGGSGHLVASPGAGLLIVAVAGLAAVLLLALVALVAARRQPARAPASQPPPPVPLPAAEAALAQAASAGVTELAGTDPRAAVLRCYAAMARTLRRAGVAGRASDVPGELLARAAATGMVPAAPARELTDLFGAARFSSHPVTEAQRQAATAALTRIRAALGGRS